jgi:hypothetical protein
MAIFAFLLSLMERLGGTPRGTPFKSGTFGTPTVKFGTARAENRRFSLSSALRVHTKPPYKIDLHRKMLRALKRPGGPGQ